MYSIHSILVVVDLMQLCSKQATTNMTKNRVGTFRFFHGKIETEWKYRNRNSNRIFWWKRNWKGTAFSVGTHATRFMGALHGQSRRHIMWPCQTEVSKQPFPYSPLHQQLWQGWRTSLLVYMSCSSFCACVKGSLGSDNHALLIDFRSVFIYFCFWQYLFSYLFLEFLYSFYFS
jgi:hypothetical protein